MKSICKFHGGSIIFLDLLFAQPQVAGAQINCYPPLSAVKKGLLNPLLPDPIFNYTWANPRASDGLESYTLKPVDWTTSFPQHFNLADFKKNNTIAVNGEGDLRFDFSQTNAAWLEFDSPDLSGEIEMRISEVREVPHQ